MLVASKSFHRVVAGYAALAVGWTLAAAPFSAPDEWSHYLRAVGVGQGRLVGDPVASFHDPALTPAQEAWVAQSARALEVPAGLSPDGYGCNAFHPEVSAACIDRLAPPSSVPVVRNVVQGTYQPVTYILPGLLLRAGKSPVSALALARAGNVLTCLAFIGLALATLSEASLPGFVLAMTPMALYLASTLNPSGPEVAAAAAFAAGLLAVGRDPRPIAWSTVATAGAALCLCRSLGPLFVLLVTAPCALAVGLGRALDSVRSHRRHAAIAATAIGLAAAANRVWEARYGPKLRFPRNEPALTALGEAARGYAEWLRECIGVFQYTDTSMPALVYLVWSLLIVIFLVFALWSGTASQRFGLLFAILLALLVPLLLQAFILRPIGWVVQGRHVLPLVVVVPLLAGEIVGLRAKWIPRRFFAGLCGAVCFGCAAIQFVAVYSDARRSAVGSGGSWLFPFHPEWRPAAGFWLPLAIALGGAVLVARASSQSRCGTGRPGGAEQAAIT